MKLHVALVLVTGVMMGAEKADKKPTAKADGTWIVTMAYRDGKANKEIVGHVVTFAADKFTIKKDGKVLYAGKVKFGPGKVSAIDFIHTSGNAEGKTWKGIWRRKGETLQICDNAPDTDKSRPTTFATKAGYALVTLKPAKQE